MIFFSGYQLVFQQLQSQLRHLLRRHHHSASFCIVVSSRSGGKASPSPLHFGFPPRKKSKVMRYLRPRSRFTQPFPPLKQRPHPPESSTVSTCHYCHTLSLTRSGGSESPERSRPPAVCHVSVVESLSEPSQFLTGATRLHGRTLCPITFTPAHSLSTERRAARSCFLVNSSEPVLQELDQPDENLLKFNMVGIFTSPHCHSVG